MPQKGKDHKGTKGGKGKGKGDKEQSGKQSRPSPSWHTPAVPPPPPYASTTTALDSHASQASQPSEELQKLRGLHKALRNANIDNDDVAKALAQVEASVGKEDTRTYKQLVSSLGVAKKEVQETNESWKNYRKSWLRYSEEMLKLWETHVAHYEAGEQQFAKDKKEALQRLEDVKLKLKAMHEKTTATEAEQFDEEEEEEHMDDTPDATIPFKKLRDAMSEAVSTMKASTEETSPRRKQPKDAAREETEPKVIPVPR